MREHTVTMTKRGQVTIPVEVRRFLDLQPGDKVRFIVDDDRVELAPARFAAESVYGSVPSIPRTDLDFKRQIEEAKEENAERLFRKLQAN